MNNSNKLLAFIAIGSIVLVFSVVVLAKGNDSAPHWMQSSERESEYTKFIEKATSQKQKDALLKLEKDFSLGIGEWKRDALIIIGELPYDMKRLKIEDVKRIIKENEDESSRVKAFNEIAGAPDWEGGSGIHRTIYFMDENRKDGIYIIANHVVHVMIDEKGKQHEVPLDDNNTNLEPRPTSTPEKK